MNRIFSAVFAAVLFMLPAAGQTPDPATNAMIDGVYRETEHNKTEILKKLRATLDDRERAIFDQVRFTIDRNAWNIHEVYADVKVVKISMGFIVHVDMINGALAYEIYDSTLQNTTRNLGRPIDFANYYVDALVTNSRSFRLGRPTVPPKSYFQWLGMTADDISSLTARLNRDSRYSQAVAVVNDGNLAMVLAHELGHHVLGHIPVRTPLGPKQEAAADAFAFKHVVKMGYPPLLALGTFMMFDRFERRYDPDHPDASDHPPALCRWFRAMTAGWAAIKDDKGLLAELKQRSRAGEVDAMDDLLTKGERQFAEKCPVSSYDLCDVITRYLTEPPTTFLAERSRVIEPGRWWEAKSGMPNAACYVRQRDSTQRTTHRFSCLINSRNSEAVVETFYNVAVGEVLACVTHMQNASGWARTSNEDTDDGEITTGQEWAFANGSVSYDIKVEMIRNKAKHEFMNAFAIEYVVRNGH